MVSKVTMNYNLNLAINRPTMWVIPANTMKPIGAKMTQPSIPNTRLRNTDSPTEFALGKT